MMHVPSSVRKRQTWTKETVICTSKMRIKLFVKPGIKKKSIWENIAIKISKLDHYFSVAGWQCEQKWKNTTKQFRFYTIDHTTDQAMTTKNVGI
jgi:hypothetical protein